MVAEQLDLWREGQEADDDELHKEERHGSGALCVCVLTFTTCRVPNSTELGPFCWDSELYRTA